MERWQVKNQQWRLHFIASLSVFSCLCLLYFHFGTVANTSHFMRALRTVENKPQANYNTNSPYPFMRALATVENKSDPCGGKYIYIHNLPPSFNDDLLKDYKNDLNLENSGLGPQLMNFSNIQGWYETNQFALDVIFNSRMKHYECLTDDSSIASAIFVPFYAGIDLAMHLWRRKTSIRDAKSLALVDWLMKTPEWGFMEGKDHFLVAGRIFWDLMRQTDRESDWGNKLLLLPSLKNLMVLVVESSHTTWSATNDYAIPYPTYFHPSQDSDVFFWQENVRNVRRKYLMSFVGPPRPDSSSSIRGHIVSQCKNSETCKLLECDFADQAECYSPVRAMRVFQRSVFCLQPRGDSYTRRSTFESMLAGCIPVFFHRGSAYTQYKWHLPRDHSKYSVFILEDDVRGNVSFSIEERLSGISEEKVKEMREEVISLIPRLIYADPRAKLETIKDAFDVTVEAVIERVTKLRRDIVEGRKDDSLIEKMSLKYGLLDGGESVHGGNS